MKKRILILPLIAALAAHGQFVPPTADTASVSKNVSDNTVAETIVIDGNWSIGDGTVDFATGDFIVPFRLENSRLASTPSDYTVNASAWRTELGMSVLDDVAFNTVEAQGILSTSTLDTPEIEFNGTTDTTLTRSAAGVLAVEGVNLVRSSDIGTLAGMDSHAVDDDLLPGDLWDIGSTAAPWQSGYFESLEVDVIDFTGSVDTTLTRSAAGVLAVEGVDVLTTATGYTQSAADAAFEPAGVTAADITDATATGQAAITAADPAALATAAGLGNVDNTSDADKPISNAAQAALDDKAAVTAVDAALAVRTYPLRNGIYSDGTDEAFTVPQQSATNIGTSDFSRGLPSIVLPDYTPATAITLWTHEDGNTGIRLILGTDGTLTIEFGDGTDWDASYATTKNLAGIAPHTPVTLAFAADRDGSVQYYLDGNPFEAVDISAASAIDVTTSNPYTVLAGAEGWTYGVYWASTDIADSVEMARYYALPDALQRTNAGVKYESDFSGGSADGWEDIGAGGIVESVSGPIDGDNDWLLQTANNNTDVKGFFRTIADSGIVSGAAYLIEFDLFTPAGSIINGYRLRWLPSNNVGIFPLIAGTRLSASHTFIASASSSQLQILSAVGVDLNWSGADGTDDLFYLRDVTLTRLGVVEVIDLSVTGATKTDVVGSNDATRGTTATDAL